MNVRTNSCSREANLEAPYIVLYDPECAICQAGIRGLRQLDTNHLTNTVPLSSNIDARIAELSAVEVRRKLHIICPNGKIKIGFAALVEIAALFPATSLLAKIAAWPPAFALGDALYNILAKYRYAFGRCKNNQCSLEK